MRYWREPLDAASVSVPHGEVHILVDRCKGCAFCVEYCPRDVLVMAETFNRKGYHPPEVVKSGECVNCNLCEMICPEFAIFASDTALANAASPSPGSPLQGDKPEEVLA